MSAGETVVKLGVKITYNLNDSPQLRLARHSPTDVTVYDDPDGTSSTTPIGAAKKKSYVGKFAELPLKVCLTALKDASPELLSNPSHDYSVYLNDPTEPSSDGSTSGVLVGKGLFSWGLEPQGGEEQTTVFGKVVKDGIRGQSVLVHLVLEKTARVARASSSRQASQSVEAAPPVPTVPAAPVPVTGNQNVNVAALLQFLSSTGSLPPLPQAPNNGSDMSQLFSALAGVYNFGVPSQPATPAPQPPQPASRSASQHKERASRRADEVVVVKEEEEEIEEIECMPSTSSAPPVRPMPVTATRPTPATHPSNPVSRPPTATASLPKASAQPSHGLQLPSTLSAAGARPRKSSGQGQNQPSGDKENMPPAPSITTSTSSNSLKPPAEPTPLSKSKSTPSLPFRGTGAVSTQNMTPFLPVPALQPKITQPAHPPPVVLFVQPIPSTLQRPEVAPPVRSNSTGSASKKKGRESHLLVGPHGNGWYRRTELLPPVPSSDAPGAPSGSAAINSDAPMSDAGDEVVKKKRVSENGDDGGARKKRKKSKVGSLAGPATSPVRGNGSRAIPMAATSPVRKTTMIKRITLKTSSKSTSSIETPPKASETTPASNLMKESSAPPARPPQVRQLNFLSLGHRPFLRTQSEGFGQLYPNNLLPPRLIPNCQVSSPALPGLSLPSLPMPSMVPAPSPTPEPSRPSTPAPVAEAESIPRPCTPVNASKIPLPPSTPKRRKKSKSPEPKDKSGMDVDDDEGDGSPLFLPTPQVDKTGSRKGTIGRDLPRMMAPPVTPTRPKLSNQPRQPPKALLGPSSDATDDAVDAALNSAFDSSDDEDAIIPPPSDLYASITAQKAPLDYKALGLPPSSPPSSFADSSSPNVSPRFTLDAMEDEEMVELMGDREADMEEDHASTPKEDVGSGSSDKSTERESSVAESATSSTSSSGAESSSSSDAVIATSDAPPPLQPQMDFATLANMLGLVNTANNDAADPHQANGMVQPVDGPFDFWNALGIVPDAPVEAVAANAPSSDGLGALHGSDIFDFDAATAEGLLNAFGGSGISPKKSLGNDAAAANLNSKVLEEDSFKTLVESL